MNKIVFSAILLVALFTPIAQAKELLAGVGKVDITRPGTDPGTNPPFIKALVLTSGETHAVIVTVDAVAIAEIGSIRDPYLAHVRKRLHEDLGISPKSLLVNASHCHAIVAPDVEDRTVQAVTEAWKNRVPVRAGSGVGTESTIMENRRLHLKDGSEADVRHAYSLPPNDEVASVGPIDPEIGILRLDRVGNGEPFAILYQFACHPIQGVPGGENTADMSGFASQVIENHLGDGTATAFFLQGCGGDINPALYKNTSIPRDGEPLGTRLGLSTLEAIHSIETKPDQALSIETKTLTLPRADHSRRIAEMKGEIDTLTKSLKGTTLNFESFLPLYVKYHLSETYPSEAASRYLQDELLGKKDWKNLDEKNRAAMASYLQNIRTMEELTRKQINLALLTKHQERRMSDGPTVEAESVFLRVGEFRLVTFPGEITVEIGLDLKEKSPHPYSFVSGYTNGYLYYSPTPEQLKNCGNAQEDSDCLLAPGWLDLFTKTALGYLQEK